MDEMVDKNNNKKTILKNAISVEMIQVVQDENQIYTNTNDNKTIIKILYWTDAAAILPHSLYENMYLLFLDYPIKKHKRQIILIYT